MMYAHNPLPDHYCKLTANNLRCIMCALCSSLQPKKIASSMDKQYWAKGTGFGTGTTTSSYNMNAARTKHQLEEKYVGICFSILTEYFSLKAAPSSGTGGDGTDVSGDGDGGPELVGGGTDGEGVAKEEKEVEGFCGVEVIELLCKSCLLPALASYLLNDSGTNNTTILYIHTHARTHTEGGGVLYAMHDYK